MLPRIVLTRLAAEAGESEEDKETAKKMAETMRIDRSAIRHLSVASYTNTLTPSSPHLTLLTSVAIDVS